MPDARAARRDVVEAHRILLRATVLLLDVLYTPALGTPASASATIDVAQDHGPVVTRMVLLRSSILVTGLLEPQVRSRGGIVQRHLDDVHAAHETGVGPPGSPPNTLPDDGLL